MTAVGGLMGSTRMGERFVAGHLKDVGGCAMKVKRLVEKYREESNPKKSKRTYQKLINIINKDSRVDKVDMVLFIEKFKTMLENK